MDEEQQVSNEPSEKQTKYISVLLSRLEEQEITYEGKTTPETKKEASQIIDTMLSLLGETPKPFTPQKGGQRTNGRSRFASRR